MDKRKLQRRGLHKNLNSMQASQSSSTTDSDDIFLNNASRKDMSQRESNTDLLRKQINLKTISAAPSCDNIMETNDQIESRKSIKRNHDTNDCHEKSPIKKRIISQQTEKNNENRKFNESIMNLINSAPHIETEKVNAIINTQRDNVGTQSSTNNNITTNNNKTTNNKCSSLEENYFNNFLRDAGITIDEENDDSYVIIDDPVIIAKKMEQLLNSGIFTANKILEEWNSYVLSNMKYFERSLNSTNHINCDGIVQISSSLNMKRSKNISLLKILLHVPQLQTQILNSSLQKLNETIVAADSIDDMPWSFQLIQQLRFIEVVDDPQLLTMKLEELLETSPTWFQSELIRYLPDIVIDTQHENIAEILCKLMEVHGDLTNVILDCITNLSLGKESLEELREKMLKMLQCNCHISKIPMITKFCLTDCKTIETCINVLRVIRNLEIHPLNAENADEYYINQMLIVNEMKMLIIMSNDMANAAVIVVNSVENVPKPFDIIMLLLLYDGTTKRKRCDSIFKQHVKTGYYDAKFLNEFYTNYKQVSKDLQPIALHMALNLLKIDDKTLIDFSSEWLRQQFITHANLIHKQREIVEKLISFMVNDDQTAKSALAILREMTKNEDEKRYLQVHCNHLRILMEKVEQFHVEEVIILNDLLYALCANSNSISDGLRDDLFILLQKQLSCRHDNIIKCKGVAGAVMAIKHLATNSTCCKMAKIIFHKVLKGVENCPRSQGFFYDKIGSVINDAKNINKEFLMLMTDVFEQNFINTYMIDLKSYSGELVPTFQLHHSDGNSDKCAVQFGQSKYGGAIVPALLRLMGICFSRINEDGNTENISALLGCAVLMPKDLYSPDTRTLDYLFHCINWFRELINIFVTQSDSILQQYASKRLDNIIDLQSELSNLLTIAEERYQPPLCYFHCSSNEIAPLKQVEKKIVKKGKQRPAGTAYVNDRSGCATLLESREKWEMATLLSTKNLMYFRRLDAKILCLIDVNEIANIPQSQLLSSSSSSSLPPPPPPPPPINRLDVNHISTNQLCFIINELLAAFEDDSAADEKYVRDLIDLLPKICIKLKIIVNKLESVDNNERNIDDNNSQNKRALRLVLHFLATILRWKQFNNSTHNTILRDGLRILAAQMDKSNSTQNSCKKLVGESYEYFESLGHVATQLPIAYALVDVCKALMKHSVTFTRQHQNKQAQMAYGFLCLEWPDDRHTDPLYKSAVVGLLKNWMDHELNPLNTVTSVLKWLPNEVKNMEKPQDKLTTFPTINKLNFHQLFLKIFDGLIKGTKISLSSASTDIKKIEVWRKVAENIGGIVSVCKMITTKNTLMVYLRHMPLILKLVLISGMPVLERNLRYQTEEITGILKMMQIGTRYLNAVCVHSTEKKDLGLTKLVPAAKTILEKLLYSVKGMLVLNNSSTAFWMGNLVNKNLDGQEILSQTSSSTDADLTSLQESHTSDNGKNTSSENVTDGDLMSDLLDSDTDNDDIKMDDDDDNDNHEYGRVSPIIDD